MNRSNFQKLPEKKRQIIENAYYATHCKEITPTDFFAICREVLTDEEFTSLFKGMEGEEEPKQGIQPQDDVKTEYIEDIMQYSGIDLKEEADNIVKESEHGGRMEQYDNRDDKNSKIDSLFKPLLFQEFIVRVSGQKQMKITTEGIYLLFQIMKRKIFDFIDRLDAASKIRVEANLAGFSFRIENEISKQLWYLNEMEKVLGEKLMIKKDEDTKKKKTIQEREDLIIKKKQSSSVAMAAMGIEQKSWMTGDGAKSNEEVSKFTPIYSPFDEKGFDAKIKARTVTMKDFIYVLERDKRYNKSVFLVQHYFK